MKKYNSSLLILALMSTSLNLYCEDGAATSKDFTFNYSLTPPRTSSFTNSYGLDLKLNQKPQSSSLLDYSFSHFDFNSRGDCSSRNQGLFGSSFSSLYTNLGNVDEILGKTQCLNIKEGKITHRFTAEYCAAYSQCIKSYPSNLTSLGMNNIISKEYAAYQLKNNAVRMADIDKVNLFALKTYGDKFKSSCSPRFNYGLAESKESKCKSSGILDEVFYNYQKSCSPTKANCFNNVADSSTSYAVFHENEVKKKNTNQSIINDFFVDKVKKDVQQSLSQGDQALQEVASFLVGSGSQENKIKNFLSSLQKNSTDKKLDPIFDFERFYISSNNFSGTELSKKLNEYFKKDKFKGNVEEVKAALKEMRLELADTYLQKQCQDSQSLDQICHLAGAIGDSKSINNLSPFSAATDLPKNDSSYFDDQKLLVNNNDPKAREEFYVTLETLRCKAFGFMPPEKKNDYISTITPGGSSYGGFKYDPTDYMYNETTSTKAIPTKSDFGFKNLALDTNTRDSSSSLMTSPTLNGTTSTDPIVNTPVKSSDVIETKPDLVDNLATSFNSTTPISTRPALQNQNTPEQNLITSQELSKVNSNPVSNDTFSSPVNDRLNTLTKSLSDAEARLKKMDADRALATEEERQRKVEADAAEIESLKTQIAQLKQNNSSTNLNGSTGSTTNTNGPDRDEQADSRTNRENLATINHQDDREKADRDRAEGDPASNYSANNHSPENSNFSSPASSGSSSSFGQEGPATTFGRQPASIGSNAGFSSAGGRSALTLTRIDGMSSEKAEETIAEMIKASNGVPFTIEEGGFIKQIIPLVVDGQIQYDSVTGKPKFEKIIKSKVEKNRAVAAEKPSAPPILDPASLRQVDQVNLTRQNERVRREKLEELTKKFRSN